MKVLSSKSMKKKFEFVGLLYLLPWILGFIIFQFYPLIQSLYYSFTNFSIYDTPDFIGVKNFFKMFFEDADFWQSLRVTFNYAFVAVPLKLGFALLVAVILSSKIKGINIFRTIFYLPSILGGSVAVAILWRFMFMKEGFINEVLSKFFIPAVDWLGSPDIALYTVSLLVVWQFGASMVLFLAGLKQIPTELYEAGKVDGASRFRMFFMITIPLLTPIIFFNLIMQTINALQEFTGAFLITGGGPLKSTYLFGMKLYEDAFLYSKMGYAAAESWVLFVIIMIFTAVIFKTSNSWMHYEDGGGNI